MIQAYPVPTFSFAPPSLFSPPNSYNICEIAPAVISHFFFSKCEFTVFCSRSRFIVHTFFSQKTHFSPRQFSVFSRFFHLFHRSVPLLLKKNLFLPLLESWHQRCYYVLRWDFTHCMLDFYEVKGDTHCGKEKCLHHERLPYPYR